MPRALITGATGGIGLQVAKNLSAKGWSLLLVGREGADNRLSRARQEVSSSSSSSSPVDVQAIPCDFASLEQVRRAAQATLDTLGSAPLDAVLLNAAVWPASVGATVEVGGGGNAANGNTRRLERTLVVNHLSQLLLARLLLPALRRSSSGGRCVFVSSELHRSPAPLLPPATTATTTLLTALLTQPLPPSTPPRAAYGFSKLCNVWMAREMQRRELADPPSSRVRFAAATPGFVPATGLSTQAAGSGAAGWLFRTIAPWMPGAVSVQEGARRLELALVGPPEEAQDEGAAGRSALYYSKGTAVEPSAAAMDDAAAAEAWRLSEELLVGGGGAGGLLAPL
jgi:NAD(P)-dependent dehydrogenase (short-subunit alcohol dehydrogenase family)